VPGRFALSPRTPLMVSAAASLVLLAACGSSASGPQSVRGPATGSAPTGTPPAGYAPWAQAENSPLHTSESTHTGPQDAKIRWKANLGGNISQGPSVGADGTIYEANDGGVLHALDPKTGADRWTFDGHGKIGSELSTTAAVLPDGTVLWPGPQHTVFGLSPAGKPLWSLKLAGTPLSPTIAAPDAFYVTTFSGDLVAVKITDGKAQARWTLHLGKQNWASPVLRADGVIETTVDNTLVAVKDEGAKARTLWQFATKKPIEVSPAVTSGGITVLGSNDGFEFGISPTGKQL
jgi:outer membrane protein assembly factor BamB